MATVRRGGNAAVDATGQAEVELALAAILAPYDATEELQHGVAQTVVLLIRDRSDLPWVERALPWLSERGRRVILRTRISLPRPVVQAARSWGATVVLELASPRAALQRALLGPSAETLPGLLLHAQYLQTAGLSVGAWVGPLVPSIHDRSGHIDVLWRHVAAAQVRDAHATAGRLSADRFEAISHAVSSADAIAVARAYALPFDDELRPVVPAQGARLPHRTSTALLHAARRSAEAAGVRIDGCGCPMLCHLSTEPAHPYARLTTADLFAAIPEAG